VLRQVGWMTGIGTVVGLAAATAIGRFAESLLFQLNSRDPFVFVTGVVLLMAGFRSRLLSRASRLARRSHARTQVRVTMGT
jgi:hypothetical protein